MKTEDAAYAHRLSNVVWWKRFFDVQRPYRNHLQSLQLGRVLEIGCGTGRNLFNLGASLENIGVDHNPASVAIARKRGLSAFTVDEFHSSEYARCGYYDSLLIAHVLEHLTMEAAFQLIKNYLPFIRKGGVVLIITPQKAGFESDPTHLTMMDHQQVAALLNSLQLSVAKQYSFPFPMWVGNFFKYNEFITLAHA